MGRPFVYPGTMKIMSPSYPRYAPSRPAPYRRLAARRRPSGWSFWLLFLALAGLVSILLLPISLLAGIFAFSTLTERVYPGVSAGWLPAGNLTRAELADKLDVEWNRQPRITLTDGAHTWPAAPADLGLWIDPQATAERAYAIGRGPNWLQEILWLARFREMPVEPVLAFDPNAARAGLQRLGAQINTPALNASLRFENGAWVSVPGQNGSTIDVETALRHLAENPRAVASSGFLPVPMLTVVPSVADLTPALERLRGALDNPLRLRAYDPILDETIEWSVPRETFAAWVTVTQQGEEVVFGLDGQRLAAYLQEWQVASLGAERALVESGLPEDLSARWLSGEPVTLTLRHNPTQYTVQPGDTLTRIAFQVGMPYWKIQEANPGIDPNRLLAGQALTIPSKSEMLPLPVVPNKRIVINISQQRLWTYENGALRSDHIISTGIDRSPTIPGIYQVRTHEIEAYASVWDLYMPHFVGIYEGWPGFMNGIHGLPTLSNGSRLWAGNLGRPVSYGCIILDLPAAEDLYSWAEEGVVVEIQP
jgi:lipoprotein-anchoring transpeptidase ErfK/SrfK